MEIRKFNLLAVLLAGLVACSDDQTVNTNGSSVDGETTTVNFEMNANVGNYSAISRAVKLPDFENNNFRIMAFKKAPEGTVNAGKYLYAQDIATGAMSLTSTKLSGEVRIPVGEYKFVSTYGLNSGGFGLPELTAQTELNDDINITHNTIDGSSVVFLENGTFDKLKSYRLGLDSKANENVTASLTRAVSRVDLLFIQATKNADGNYTEAPDLSVTDVFGGQLDNIQMQFTNLNKNVNLLGERNSAKAPTLFNGNLTVQHLEKAVTIGTAAAGATKVGTSDYKNYDNIVPEDIQKGSAHVHGAYVLPFEKGEIKTGLTLALKNKIGDVRTIEIPDILPLERNKVTLVKIRVLTGTVFHTNAQFEVTVDTAWLDNANTIEGEIN